MPSELVPGTDWIGGWVGLRAGLDAVEKRNISCPCQELNPQVSRPYCNFLDLFGMMPDKFEAVVLP
jgi:hypothetical protein